MILHYNEVLRPNSNEVPYNHFFLLNGQAFI